MKRIFLLLFFLLPAAVASESSALMEQVRESLVVVGRAGREALVPGVVLGDGKLVLAPVIPSIDHQPAPYLIRLQDGEILSAEVVSADEERTLVLLRLARSIATPIEALKISAERPAAPPFLSASVPLGLLDGEPLQVHVAKVAIQTEFKEERGEDDPAPLDLAIARSGYPLFDLSGRLVGVTGRFDDESQMSSWIPLQRAFENLEEASEILVEGEPISRDKAPAIFEVLKEGEREAPPWLVVVENATSTTYQSCHGIIVDPGGLILTKASMLGPKPICRIGTETFPAALLAEDFETDLALLAISAKELTPVSWSKSTPPTGSEVFVPVINPSPPLNRPRVSGLLSHSLEAHPLNPPTIWSSEEVTSLGVLIDQAKTAPTVVFVIPGRAGAKAGLRPGDVLVAVGGEPVPDRKRLRDQLSPRRIGDTVTLSVTREGVETDLQISLAGARLAPPPLMDGRLETLPAVEALPSVRRSGFPSTWVHDARLAPWQMMTPLVDSAGAAQGINIASIGYGRCLALPAEVVQAALSRLLQQPVNL